MFLGISHAPILMSAFQNFFAISYMHPHDMRNSYQILYCSAMFRTPPHPQLRGGGAELARGKRVEEVFENIIKFLPYDYNSCELLQYLTVLRITAIFNWGAAKLLNTALVYDQTRWAGNCYRVDHVPCPGQKFLWHECWRAICFWHLLLSLLVKVFWKSENIWQE